MNTQQTPQSTPSSSTAGKRRRKGTDNGDDAPAPSEPRRLRRSHEACARCRSKKIKASACDSKHPRCTACATAGTACNQEDRHRQTLTPRGHTDHLEHQLAQCEALLKIRYPGFSLETVDEFIARENVDPNSIGAGPVNPVFQGDPMRLGRGDPGQPPKGYPMFQPPPHPGYPPYHPMMPGPYAPHYPLHGPPPPGAYPPSMHPGFQHPGAPYPPPPPIGHPPGHPPPVMPPPGQQPPPPASTTKAMPPSKGTDPNGNDMSNTEALAKNFGVSAAIANVVESAPQDREDLAVGSNGLSSGRDRSEVGDPGPRDATQWIQVLARRNSTSGTPPNTIALTRPTVIGATAEVWLPKDREMAKHIIDVYFTHLNLHRPVFGRQDLQKILDELYDGTSSYDPGHICSIYLIFALGTLSDLNHRAVNAKVDDASAETASHLGPTMAKNLMPPTWPQHDEFFQRALTVKPDLRVTISSLQALILLHWYLYTERQGRTLWRLVGSLVRLSIELGLHHDPTTQLSQNVFTEEECQLRIRLWGIVLIHDRGTSILLGRPLAISPSDTNTPRPSRPLKARFSDFSEHFELSHPIAEIQADIINSLYTPNKQAPDTIMRNATRIIKSMSEFRRSMPDRYKFYFTGTEAWPIEDRVQLVQKITEDEGLTLLKLGIARILLLRALFSSKELSYTHRRKALIDAIITSHNTIIIHNQLIRFPDIAFFTSPIPLHIAAMVILYGHMSKVNPLPFDTKLEDLWLALDMLPRFRWRWERKDFGGAHPLIARLAERVMNVNLRTYTPTGNSVLMPEPDWDDDSHISPVLKSQQAGSAIVTAGSSYPQQPAGPTIYGPQPRSIVATSDHSLGSTSHSGSSGGSTPNDKQLVDVPTNLFYPFYPEDTRNSTVSNGNDQQGYTHILAQAAAPASSYGCQPSQDSYMSEERDMGPAINQQGTAQPQHQQPASMMWVNVVSDR
ncbi:hypothetical protein FA15DRAFT_603884 [Coprinopsis marcescibilis]|uniref:Zn(2)-C6 fungal-type domain-containing protein n=1 Tax=Coprinopsis marcescibilis TaxID=230819 RepID=A0A5C3KDH5_COPMA|nr:hypothetical protein FA15DRAFT_603884 [Coprinopsis marcescibilis]